jgi:pyruvate dehydrogenase E1 component
MSMQGDIDVRETTEWIESLSGVIASGGPARAHYLIETLIATARQEGVNIPYSATTEYINTIPAEQQPPYPGDPDMEIKLHSYIRWNAMAMVVRANKDTNVGGHIASFASAAALYDVGFSHFWHAPSDAHDGDMIYFQGHSVPGIYARAFMLGRLTEDQMDNFRQEVGGKGISSYPHPWLMPDFWQFPTVSMGLGPLCAIYQARFMKYMASRNMIDAARAEQRKVWAFLGDGETDEVESLGAIGMAGRERLDNLVFVINCNLQRLDGPVRGNGKIIQELESGFRGAGWNVIKVIWGTQWDALFARDKSGLLKQRMMEICDGEYQTFKAKDGAYVREHFFNTPELRALVADWTDEQVWQLNRGGHDLFKIFTAYKAANEHKGQPTLILAKTIKGFGMGQAGEAMNISHQQKKLDIDAIRRFRDRFGLPVPDDKLAELPYLKFAEGSPEYKYMMQRRLDLGGFLPQRRTKAAPLAVPALDAFAALLKASGEGRELSTTMAVVRIMNTLLKDKQIGRHIVPIVPDESRTFGMEGMFRQYGIWNQEGQKYVPEDHDQLMFYKESKTGQVLQEGINEAGAMADWIAAGTAYSVHGVQMIPFYIFYSMFGLQRTMDLCWAAADQRTRGFMIGGTAGRTTLERRRPAARGRPQPVAGQHDPQLRELRPDLPVRGCGGGAGRPAPHVRRAGGRVLLHHGDERELRASRDAGGRRSRHPQGPVRLPQGRRGQGPARAADGCGHDLPRGDRRGRAVEGRLGCRVGPLGCAELQRAGPQRPGRRALEPAAPARSAAPVACRTEAGRCQGSGRRRHRLHQAVRRADPPLRQGAVRHAGHRRFRPFRHPREIAPPFRGRPSLGHAGCPEGAGRRRRDRTREGRRRPGQVQP